LRREINFEELSRKTDEEVREVLLSLPGVGIKLVDHFLLFGLGRTDVVPVDIWLERAFYLFFRNEFENLLKR
jgi:N-glycosylase/DNA lyase